MTDPASRVHYWRAWLSWALTATLVLRYAVPLLAVVAAIQWHEKREHALWWIALAVVAWLAHVDLTRSGVVERAREIFAAWSNIEGCNAQKLSPEDIEEMESHLPHLPWLETRQERESE